MSLIKKNAEAPKPVDINAKLKEVQGEIEVTRRELKLAQDELREAEIEEILTGKAPEISPATIATLEAKLSTLEANLNVLLAAQTAKSKQLDQARAKETAQRVASLTLQYREKVQGIISAVDLLLKAQAAADECFYQFPSGTVTRVVGVPGTLGAEWLAMQQEQLCRLGYAELLDAQSIGRRRWEHECQHTREVNERAAKQQAARLISANDGIIPDDLVFSRDGARYRGDGSPIRTR